MKNKSFPALNAAKTAFTFKFHPRLVHLIVHVTSKCPNKCRACFAPKSSDDLPLNVIQQLADDAQDLLCVDIGGGEPFLRDDLPEVCAAFTASDMSIPTSGWNPDRIASIARQTLDVFPGMLTIGVSLDGFQKTNDALRGEGLYESALATVRELSRIDRVSVKINTVISQANFGELLEFMKFVKSLGVDYHSLLLLRGDPSDAEMRLPPVSALKSATDDIFRILKQYPYLEGRLKGAAALGYHRLLWDYSMQILESGKMPLPCLAGLGHLVVYADGSASPCELLPPLGNVKQDSLHDIMSGNAMNEARKKICGMGCACTHNCNMVENILFDFSSWPKLLTRIFHEIIL